MPKEGITTKKSTNANLQNQNLENVFFFPLKESGGGGLILEAEYD